MLVPSVLVVCTGVGKVLSSRSDARYLFPYQTLSVPTHTTTSTLLTLCRNQSIDLRPLFGQLQETTIEKFEKTVKDDNIPIVISTFDDSPL
jgi:hypothetical protein